MNLRAATRPAPDEYLAYYGKYIALGRRVAEEHLEEIKSLVDKRTASHESEIADNQMAGLA